MVYKVSYVVVGSEHPGAIINHPTRPKVGDHVTIGRYLFEIEEIHDMMSLRTDFHFLHATVRLVPEPGKEKVEKAAKPKSEKSEKTKQPKKSPKKKKSAQNS